MDVVVLSCMVSAESAGEHAQQLLRRTVSLSSCRLHGRAGLITVFVCSFQRMRVALRLRVYCTARMSTNNCHSRIDARLQNVVTSPAFNWPLPRSCARSRSLLARPMQRLRPSVLPSPPDCIWRKRTRTRSPQATPCDEQRDPPWCRCLHRSTHAHARSAEGNNTPRLDMNSQEMKSSSPALRSRRAQNSCSWSRSEKLNASTDGTHE